MPPVPLPDLKLDHLLRLTDCTGMIQHARYALPDRESGYTTDDNARALIVALKLYEDTRTPQALRLAERYLGFLAYAQRTDGKFRNFVAYNRSFLEEEGSEDAFGRALWACGYAVSGDPDAGLVPNAHDLLEAALPRVAGMHSPRAWAYSLLGLVHWLEAQPDHSRVYGEIKGRADALVDLYRRTAGPGWRWFENSLTYSNGVLPMALFLAYQFTGKKAYLGTAVESLDFLLETLVEQGRLRLVGNRGWYHRGGEKAAFDEQPVDAGETVLAALAACQATGKREYAGVAEVAFTWFLGDNAAGRPLYDPRTGGCYDGLTPEGINLNQGAESLLAYLLAHLAILEARQGGKKELAESGA